MTTSSTPTLVRSDPVAAQRSGPQWNRTVVGVLLVAVGVAWLLSTTGVVVPWRLHVLAGPGPRLDEPGLAARVNVHRLARTPGRALLGLRPDGYLGFCGGADDVAGLRAWLARAGGTAPPFDLG